MKQVLILFLTFFSLNSIAQRFFSESEVKEYWKTNGMEKIEGIYECPGSYEDVDIPCRNQLNEVLCYTTWRRYDPKYKVALVKITGEFKLIYLTGTDKGAEKIGGCHCTGKSFIAAPRNYWNVGDVKAQLYKTASPDIYKCDWYMSNKSLNTDSYITVENNGYFKLLISGDESRWLKLYPTQDDDIQYNNQKIETSSATGFAISSNGYIVTNYHVTNGASSIKVRGINGDFSKLFSANLVIEDKNNDLSIIHITDPTFTSLGVIPFTISSKSSDVGNTVFALGYPLKAVMGDEIKLTNGIISSKSGFQGDVTSYQISVPLQPGNSGGPLFDGDGNLIGIVNAKLTIGENVSYAIKSSYLLNLIDLMPSPLALQTIGTLKGKPLSSQVKVLNKFVYIIEIN